MGLGIYSEANPDNLLSSVSPFVTTFDGRIGGVIDQRIYIRNDDSDRWYTDISVQPVDPSGENIVDGSQLGFEWKLIQKDIVPTHEEWALVSPGNSLTLDSNLGNNLVGDIITFLLVWVRVKIPRGQRIQTIKDVVLRITATENAVNG